MLLSLPSFTADLRHGRQQLEEAGLPLSTAGVYSALLDCVAARDNLAWWVLAGWVLGAEASCRSLTPPAAAMLPRRTAGCTCLLTWPVASHCCRSNHPPCRDRRYITPTSLKRALDAHSAAFQGAFQQVGPRAVQAGTALPCPAFGRRADSGCMAPLHNVP